MRVVSQSWQHREHREPVWQEPSLQFPHVFYSMLKDPSAQVVTGLQQLMNVIWVSYLSHSTGAFILDFIVAKVNLHQPLIGVLLQGLANEASTCNHTTHGLLF